MPFCRILTSLLFLVTASVLPLRAETGEEIDFDRDIKPILSDRCFTCHGPDGENRKADLRLDLRDGALGDSGVVRPGEPEESELYRRISATDAEHRMPPPDSNLELDEDEIERIRRWIQQGAPWKEHWAFTPLRAVTPPPVRDPQWPINEIDRFVLARLEQENLAPAETASREKLIRRLSFDLTGLPPTLDEIDDFLSDESPDAYEAVVDRLLDSPRFGERMASPWLDVARYSDSYGYQVDRDRYVWPWRDWVVRALNDNMPYDQFITEQLAGDLLPDATQNQILATTFNRLHPQKVEGGSIPEEFRVEYVADRTQTVGTAFLGLTMECCRCHDHKYDPLTQKEYYQLFAFFNNVDEAGLYSYFTEAVPTPTLLLTDKATDARLAKIEKRISQAETELAEIAENRKAAFAEWLSGDRQVSASEADAQELPPIPGRIAHREFEEQSAVGDNRLVDGRRGQAVELTGDDGVELDVGNFRRFEPFSVALWMNTPDEKERAVVFHRSRAWTDAASRGYQLLIEDGRLSASLIHFWPGNAIRVRTRDKLPTGQWVHVAIGYDGSSRAAGLKIYVDGQPAECEIVRDNLYKNITGGGGDHITIGQRFRDRGFTRGRVDEFQVFDRQLSAVEVAQLHDGQSLVEALEMPAGRLSEERREGLYQYYLGVADPDYQQQLGALQALREQRSQLADSIQEIMVMRELPEPRPTFLLERGAYDAHGEAVRPDTPAVFPPLDEAPSRNRLALARWLTTSNRSLTARVAVNRLWQSCFGQGLVRTPEDFGRQGESPTHPDLLDWLARDFIESGWNVKRMLKMMVMSATYRQSSSASPQLLERDPENRLLARAPSYRLSAEMLRDNALAVSGLLVDKIGGPPVRPYEVTESFKPVERDEGEGLYRRSLYTYWKRTGPAPVMMSLDASKRDVCRMRREQTSSPLQALVLLNGPQFVEAARALAQRLIHQHGQDTDAILEDMFRVLTSRHPDEAEQQVLNELYSQQLHYFRRDQERAKKYLETGDAPRAGRIPAARLAALSAVANTLFSFDQCVMKR